MAENIALAMDIWTSREVKAYITVIAHYLDFSWKIQTFVFKVCAFHKYHTGEEIARKQEYFR